MNTEKDILLSKRDDVEEEILALESEIDVIRCQLTEYRSSNINNRTKTWYTKANTAMLIKKTELKKLKRDRELVSRRLKEIKAEESKRRETIENHLFYMKLKELLSFEDFQNFMDFVAEEVENAD